LSLLLCSFANRDVIWNIVVHSVVPAYGLATASRIDSIVVLSCRIWSFLLGFFAKETCNFIDPTNQSHTIAAALMALLLQTHESRFNSHKLWRVAINSTPWTVHIQHRGELCISAKWVIFGCRVLIQGVLLCHGSVVPGADGGED